MKKQSIASVSALIALSAATASAAIVAASFPETNLDLTSGFSLGIDVDGNHSDDFLLEYNYENSAFSIISGLAGNEIHAEDMCVQRFNPGATISRAGNSAETLSWTNLIGQGASYIGIKFITGGQTNPGWLQFDFPDHTHGRLIRGAWENTPGQNIPAGELPEEDGWLAVNVTPATGRWRLTAPPDYAGPASGTGKLSAVRAAPGEYTISYGALSNHVPPGNQTQFISAGSTGVFDGVYLLISTNIGTPQDVSATAGTYTNKISISWQSVQGATGYTIWRALENNAHAAERLSAIPAAQQSNGRCAAAQPNARQVYDDNSISQLQTYYYWVAATTDQLSSPMSYAAMGYAAIDPQTAKVSADIAVSDFIFLPINITNQSHPGTISCWISNHGPNNLSNTPIQISIYLTNATATAWIGSVPTNLTLKSGQEKLIILPASAKPSISVRGDLKATYQPAIHIRHLAAINDPNLRNNIARSAGTVAVQSAGVNSTGRTLNDYDGDGKADLALCATDMSAWGVLLSGTRYTQAIVVQSGHSEWSAVPGDYEGSGITGVGVYVPGSGLWYVWFPLRGHGVWGLFGGPEFMATAHDIDGDTKTDPVIYREKDGCWQGAASSTGYIAYEAWLGATGCRPVMADYDGDRLADLAIYHQPSGLWSIGPSSAGYRIISGCFGGAHYLPVPADYDGDGLVDPAIYDPMTANWQALFSGSLKTHGAYAWCSGFCGDYNSIPVPADYDGDGLTDPATYHQDTGMWEVCLSTRAYQACRGICGGPAYRPVSE